MEVLKGEGYMGEYVMKNNVNPDEINNYTIEAPTLSSWLKREDKPIVLDIRTKEDYKKFYIKDSIHSEWDDVEHKLRLGVFPKHKKIVVICYVGISSAEIATDLRLAGYDAYTLKDGILGEWQERGYPIEQRAEVELD